MAPDIVKWEKRGLIFRPDGRIPWSRSHAQLPIADACGDRWRIYFATRDDANRSNICFVEVAAGRPQEILRVHDTPLLPFGPLGAFDESGLMPLCIVPHGGKRYLFYAGWSLRHTVPYQNAIGLAVSSDGGGSFEKAGPGPLFGPQLHEPYFTGTINVLVEDGLWRAWYQSCTKWEVVAGRPEPFYHLKYAESRDGIEWTRRGVVAIDHADEAEGGISSASVVRDGPLYRMWFSHRGAAGYRDDPARSYRIGYAESADGIAWRRCDDQAGIDVSPTGWDSEMIAYPNVLRRGNELYMFYNGNGFGRTGFGYAVAACPPDRREG